MKEYAYMDDLDYVLQDKKYHIHESHYMSGNCENITSNEEFIDFDKLREMYLWEIGNDDES